MAKARRRLPSPSPAAARLAVPYVTEQHVASRYTARWHRVRRWAEDTVTRPGFEPVEGLTRGKWSPRVEALAASRVRELDDPEEAYPRGLPLEALDDIPRGPMADYGGRRRVVITALTWVPDHGGEIGYDPAWITLGHGMTANVASMNARRFIVNYERGLRQHSVSRELVVTAIEVKFWTSHTARDYL